MADETDGYGWHAANSKVKQKFEYHLGKHNQFIELSLHLFLIQNNQPVQEQNWIIIKIVLSSEFAAGIILLW